MYKPTSRVALWCAAFVLFCLIAGGATAATIVVPDDEPTIQAAINNATAGDTIFVDSGTYCENLEVNKTLVLMGNTTGWDLPIIDGGSNGSTVNITAEDVVFEHFNVTGSGSDYMGGGCDYAAGIRAVADNATIYANIVHDNYNGISLNGSDDSWVDDNWVYDNSEHGIYLGDANNNRVTWNNASSNSQNGIMLNFNSTGNLVADNDVSYNSYMGIRLRWASYNIIRDNTLTEDYGYGDLRIQEDCWYNTVTGNTIIDAYYHGIRIEENCSYNQVTENTVLGCDRPGIMLKDDCDHNTVTDNFIDDTGSGPGITVQYSRDNLIAENEIRNASCGGGVYLYYAMQNTVRDNAIFDSYTGVYLYSAVQNTVHDNAIFNSSDYGVEVYWFSDNNQVLDNIIEEAGSDGIYVTTTSSRNIISGNEVNGSYNDGIYVQDSDNNTFRENIITNGHDDGINLYNASHNIFTGNVIQDNPQNGIYLDTGSSGNRFTENIVTDNVCSGVLVEASDDNYFMSNLFADSGYYGIEVYDGSIGAVFRKNYILNNTLGGAYLWSSVSDCTFYDNYFNNTQNALFECPTTVAGHLWNATPTTGPNIVGGPLIGGNFWVTPCGDGWSETHDDADHDGFCDESYNVSDSDPSDNWDCFPLHAPYADFTVSGRSGIAPYTVTFTDASGLGGVPADYYNWTFGDGAFNDFYHGTSVQHTYTVPGIYDVRLFVTNIYGNDTVLRTDWIYVYQQSSGTSGGGSGGGTGTGAGTGTQGTPTEEKTVTASDGIAKLTVPAGTQALDKDGNPLGDISIVPLADIPKEPEGLFSFAGYAWQCTPAGATFDPPITLTLTFTAEEWAALDPASLTLEWYNPATGLWETIPAVIDPVSHTVTAQISHFSVFALFEAAEEVVIAEETTAATAAPTTAAPTTAPTTQSPLVFAPVLALGAIPFLARRK